MPAAGEIWVVALHRHGILDAVTLEVLHEAKEVALQSGLGTAAVVLGSRADHWPELLAAHGADRVYLVEGAGLDPYSAETYVPVLERLIRERQPQGVWLGATADGRDLAPRLAVRLRAPLVAGCVRVRPAPGGRFECTRPVLDGKLHATVEVPRAVHPCIVSFVPGFRGTDAAPPGAGGPGAAAVVERRAAGELSDGVRRVRHREFVPADHRTVDIREATRIVGAGRGVGGPEGVRLVAELADRLGAAVGGTRVAVDRGWLPFERQIGTTGRMVSPRLYVACGVSGAVQHVAGLKGVEHLIAVNTDRTAPIFAFADLGVVGDARAVLEALIRLLDRAEEDGTAGMARDVAAARAAGGAG